MAIKAVLDTNVFISGLIMEQGAPHQVIDAWLAGEYTLVTSPYLIDELKHVLTYPRITKRLRLSDVELGAIFHTLSSQAEITPGQYQLPGVTRDPKTVLHPILRQATIPAPHQNHSPHSIIPIIVQTTRPPPARPSRAAVVTGCGGVVLARPAGFPPPLNLCNSP